MKIVSSQANIWNMFFDQKSPPHPEVGFSRWHTQTDGHGDCMTELAQRADAIKKTTVIASPDHKLLQACTDYKKDTPAAFPVAVVCVRLGLTWFYRLSRIIVGELCTEDI